MVNHHFSLTYGVQVPVESQKSENNEQLRQRLEEEIAQKEALIEEKQILVSSSKTFLILEINKNLALENQINSLVEQQSINEIEFERTLSGLKRLEREKEELEQKVKELKKAIESNQNSFVNQTKQLQSQFEKQILDLVIKKLIMLNL